MGIGKVLSFLRNLRNGDNFTDTKNDVGGGDIVRAKHFADPGDDSAPLPGDFCINVPTKKTGNQAAAGYVDPKNAGISQPGEARKYARDSAGSEVSQIYQQNDGAITIENAAASLVISPSGQIDLLNGAGFIQLLPSGTVNINGTTIDAAGNIVGAGTISDAGGRDLTAHKHPAGTPPGNTGSAIP